MVSALSEFARSKDTLSWLLELSDPSPRYLSLTRVLGRPGDDPQVLASCPSVPRASPAREILPAHYPQGYRMHSGVQSLLDAPPDSERDDPSLHVARSWLARRKLPDGRWLLERVPGKTWANIGAIGRPDKWITLRALALNR